MNGVGPLVSYLVKKELQSQTELLIFLEKNFLKCYYSVLVWKLKEDFHNTILIFGFPTRVLFLWSSVVMSTTI